MPVSTSPFPSPHSPQPPSDGEWFTPSQSSRSRSRSTSKTPKKKAVTRKARSGANKNTEPEVRRRLERPEEGYWDELGQWVEAGGNKPEEAPVDEGEGEREREREPGEIQLRSGQLSRYAFS